MSKKKIIGECHLCGKIKPLSFEHIPPEKAFNDHRVRAVTFEQLIGNKTGSKIFQHGYGDFTLCESCNNNTGSWYGRAYIDFVYQAMKNRTANCVELVNVILNEFTIYPARVFKQIITMFFTVNYSKFRECYPALSDYILDRDNVAFPKGLRLYAYYIEDMETIRISPGVVGIYNTETGTKAMFSEFAYPPLGYLLAYDDEVLDDRLADITFFSDFGHDDEVAIQLNICPLPIAYTFFGEFRTPEEIERKNNESK